MGASIRLAVASIVLAAARPTAAGEPPTDRAVLRIGTYLPQTHPSALNLGSYGAGLDLEVAAGRAFLPWLGGEFGAGYLASGSNVSQDAYPGQFGVAPMKTRFSLVAVTASVKLIVPGGSVEPCAFGGAGVYFASLKKEPTGALPSVSSTDTILGFHAGAGVTWLVSDRVLLGLDGRYSWVRGEFFGGQGFGSGYRFDGVGLTATVGYRF